MNPNPYLNMFNTSTTCRVHDDDNFGPFVASSCRQGYDFTLLFEQSILTILPSTIYFLASLPRIRYLWAEKVKLLPNPARVWKLVLL